MKPWMQWAVGIGLVVAAWGVAAITPVEERREAPFEVRAAVGEAGVGRNIAVTVDDVSRSEKVTSGRWVMEGNWIVVDLDVAAVTSESGVKLGNIALVVDGVTFSASERPPSLRNAALHAGVPQSGSVVFELPKDLDSGRGEIRFSLNTNDRLDSVIVVPIDLSELSTVKNAELVKTHWSNE